MKKEESNDNKHVCKSEDNKVWWGLNQQHIVTKKQQQSNRQARIANRNCDGDWINIDQVRP